MNTFNPDVELATEYMVEAIGPNRERWFDVTPNNKSLTTMAEVLEHIDRLKKANYWSEFRISWRVVSTWTTTEVYGVNP